MSRRTTKCLTWGEMRRSGETLRDADGRWIGHISFAIYVTLCGREDDDNDPDDAGKHIDRAYSARPIGICRACWSQFRINCAALLAAP